MLAFSQNISGRLSMSKRLPYKSVIRQAGVTKINGKNSTALVLGGFGFKEKHINRYSSLYTEFDFNVLPILSSVKELTYPIIAVRRGKNLADQLQKINQPLAIHVISGSFWTMIYALEYMEKDWRDKYVRAIVLDSCPLMSNIYTFGGWLSFALKLNYLKPYVSHLFYPYICLLYTSDAADE